MSEATMTTIEKLTRVYAEAAGALRESVGELEAELEAIKKGRMRAIRALVAKTADAQAHLHAAISAVPEAFERPKTQTFSGIRVGYQKGKGGLDWEDDDALVAKIERIYGDQAADYLLIKKKPSADALERLDAAELKRLGVVVVDTGEQVVIRHVDGAVEKLVKALLAAKVKEATEAA
jgi:hypothetical protein